MKKVAVLQEVDNGYDLFVDGEKVDSGTEEQASYMLYRKFGFNKEGFTCDHPNAYEDYIRDYLMADGEELPRDYRVWLTGCTAISSINTFYAERAGYSYYKKFVEAGFQEGFAAKMGVMKASIDINPDKEEVLALLGLKEIGSH